MYVIDDCVSLRCLRPLLLPFWFRSDESPAAQAQSYNLSNPLSTWCDNVISSSPALLSMAGVSQFVPLAYRLVKCWNKGLTVFGFFCWYSLVLFLFCQCNCAVSKVTHLRSRRSLVLINRCLHYEFLNWLHKLALCYSHFFNFAFFQQCAASTNCT